MLLEVKIAIVVLASLIAAYTDYKKGYIYDWLNWPFIALGAILAIFSPGKVWAFIQAGLVFAFGYILYRTGKIGGGDIKFFAGLALFFPFYNGVPFILVVLFLSSLFALLFYGIYYLILLLRKPNRQIYYSLIISFVVSLVMLILFLIFSYWYLALVISIFSFFTFFSLLLKETIMQRFYRREISINKLLSDDLVDMKTLSGRYNKVGKISKSELFPLDNNSFKKLKLLLPKTAKIVVYRNLPVFGPFIALGVILGFVILTFFDLSLFL